MHFVKVRKGLIKPVYKLLEKCTYKRGIHDTI
jgi:hypothetical protein